MSLQLRPWMEKNEWIGLAAIGLLWTCLCFYPGVMNKDAAWQFDQALTGHFSDWHPPLMAYVWRFLNRIVPGTAGLFLFHVGLFWIGFSLFASHLLRSRLARVMWVLGVGLYLPLLCAFGMIIKDGGVLGGLVFACGMLLNAEYRKSRVSLGLALLALSYVFGVRQNAFPAVAPLCLGAGKILRDLRGQGRPVLLGIGCFLMIAGSVYACNRWIIRPTKTYVSQSGMLFDVVAVSIAKETNYLPAFYNRGKPPLSLKELKAVFNPHEESSLLWEGWAGRPGRVPGFLRTETEYASLKQAWVTVLLQQPAAYLAHRWNVFKAVLGIVKQSIWPYWMSLQDVRIKPFFNNPIKERLIYWMGYTRHAWIYHGWFYLGLIGLTGILGLCFGVKNRPAFIAIISSVVLYELGYFFASPSHSFRYSWWAMGASFLLPLLLHVPACIFPLTAHRRLGTMAPASE